LPALALSEFTTGWVPATKAAQSASRRAANRLSLLALDVSNRSVIHVGGNLLVPENRLGDCLSGLGHEPLRVSRCAVFYQFIWIDGDHPLALSDYDRYLRYVAVPGLLPFRFQMTSKGQFS
jgi:hypothetical protein